MSQTPDPIDIAAGARIRAGRKSLGMSQTRLAEALDLTFQQVQKYERGTNRVSASTLVRIAQMLETTVSALVGEPGTAAPQGAQVLRSLGAQGALDLLNAYVKIPDADVRRAILQMAQAIGKRDAKAEAV